MEARGVRWADIMDDLDKSEDAPVRPAVSQPIRPPTPPRRTLQGAIDRRKQLDRARATSNVHATGVDGSPRVYEPAAR